MITTLTNWLYADRRDKAAIHQFLRDSLNQGRFTYRSTAAVSRATGVDYFRVLSLLKRLPEVRRSRGQREVWTLR